MSLEGLLNGDTNQSTSNTIDAQTTTKAASYPSPPLTAEGSPAIDDRDVFTQNTSMDIDAPAHPVALSDLPQSQVNLAPSSFPQAAETSAASTSNHAQRHSPAPQTDVHAPSQPVAEAFSQSSVDSSMPATQQATQMESVPIAAGPGSISSKQLPSVASIPDTLATEAPEEVSQDQAMGPLKTEDGPSSEPAPPLPHTQSSVVSAPQPDVNSTQVGGETVAQDALSPSAVKRPNEDDLEAPIAKRLKQDEVDSTLQAPEQVALNNSSIQSTSELPAAQDGLLAPVSDNSIVPQSDTQAVSSSQVVEGSAEAPVVPPQASNQTPSYPPLPYPAYSAAPMINSMSPSASVSAAGTPMAYNPSAPADTPSFRGDVSPAFSSPAIEQNQSLPPSSFASQPQPLPHIGMQPASGPITQRPYLDFSRSPAPMPKDQQKWCNSIIKALKKSKDAPPFLHPVDPIYLGLPTYYAIITEPMDLSTVEKKLHDKCYSSVQEFTADVKRIFNNCYKFNGETAPVSMMAKNMEALFDKQSARPPVAKAGSPSVSRKNSTIRKDSGLFGADRPKRDVVAPAHYDAIDDYGAPQALPRKKKTAYGQQGEDLKFCKEVWRELTKKANAHVNWVFMEPVDYIKLNLPDYPKIVKRPMDLGTMKQKLDNAEYVNADQFYKDFKLIIQNCFAYNPPGTDVNRMGTGLDAIFEAKWLDKPDPASEYGSGSESDEGIIAMERQLEQMRDQLVAMKDAKMRRKAEKRAQQAQAAAEARAAAAEAKRAAAAAVAASRPPPQPRVSSGPSVPKPAGPKVPRRSSTTNGSGIPRARKSARHSSDEEFGGPMEVTWQMKQELANGIGQFEGDRLGVCIDIIRRSRPDLLGDDNKEIELDIDQLDANTLLKLYNFVCGPIKNKRHKQETLTASGQKAQKGGRAGTGGLKGKSLDENEETARIRALEAKLEAFNNPGVAGAPSAAPNLSESSSEDDESDSDSD